MNTIEDFVTVIRDEVGLPVTADQVMLEFDQLPGWDSTLLLHLLAVLERETGRTISFPAVLEAPNLQSIYALVVDG